ARGLHSAPARRASELPGHGGDARGAAGHRDADLLGRDLSTRCFDASHAIAFPREALDLAVLDDVDAQLIRGARIAPCDSVMADRDQKSTRLNSSPVKT